MNRQVFLFLALMLSFSQAFSSEYYGEVKGLYVNANNTVYVKLANSTTVPECGNGNWNFGFAMGNEVSKAWLSMLLTSRATNTTIKIGYTPNSDGICSIAYFYYLD
jgi:hypothetical protein